VPHRLAAGETRISTRDTIQKLLVGEPEQEGEWGSGAIPRAALCDVRRASTGPSCLDSLNVRHASGGTSTLLFKACEQGRAKWQGDTLHGVWFDQEPPLDIYTEGLTRTNATDGIVMLTFTPLITTGIIFTLSTMAAIHVLANLLSESMTAKLQELSPCLVSRAAQICPRRLPYH